jgi:GNAT superfamily N-acetyltransferase
MDAMPVTLLPSRMAVLEAVGHHPYGRFVAGVSVDLTGIAVHDASGVGVFWRCVGPFGPYGHAFGDAAMSALDEAGRRGLLAGLDRLNLPADMPLPAGWAQREAWEYRWLPSRLIFTAEPAVCPVEAADEIDRLLDEAYPDTELRPGHPLVARWYGLRVDGELVACAADRSGAGIEPDAVPTGVIGAVAVHPTHRGRGLGAAVTAGVATRLLASYDQVGLGVTEGNDTATRVYERLGFTGVYRLRSVRPA